ncbi:hypothetical protein B0T22DRAFT_298410 [Podospora appendiculata]|uniref:Dimethylaniline monooxygenase n=1 Tax=Podospora appendiculata TaxID=314037 RepID=A0AAE0X043_9PEZI|nr:hypothetical protein B0T22DRAFT_298410 [Podospora appendiculata]
MRVAVVGGGPGGLATLKYLATAHQFFPGMKPIEVKLFEAEDKIGGTFRYRTYEEGELVSSKFLTCFSDLRASINEPQFMKVSRYLEYLEEYCNRFDLFRHMHLSTRVVSITRQGKGHVIRYQPTAGGDEEDWSCDAVSICSGLHVKPELPTIPGLDKVPVVFHSSEFKSREQFGKDKTVVILGVGETSMDISYLAVTAPTKRVVVCHRSGWSNAPKFLPETDFLPFLSSKSSIRDPFKDSTGIPIDVAYGTIFDTAYVHPILRDSMFQWHFHNYVFGGSLPWVMTGTFLAWDQWVGRPQHANHHAARAIFNKSNRAMPYINAPFRRVGQGPLSERIRAKIFNTPCIDTAGRVIDVTSWPTHIDETGRMHFLANGSPEYERMKDDIVRPDVVILATGYRKEFPFLAAQDAIAAAAAERTKTGTSPPAPDRRPYARPETANVRHIWARDDPTVAFIGFLRPTVGAIPPVAEMQAMLWVVNMVQRFEPTATIPGLVAGKNRLPALRARDQWHYMLLRDAKDRVRDVIDHDSYVYQLACDMDCAPSITDLVQISWQRGWKRGWNILPCWALVSQINTKFRLRGPWAWDGAADVVHGELWTIIERKGSVIGIFLQTAFPFAVFGFMNLLCWIYATVLGLFGIEAVGPYTPVDEVDDDKESR